MPTFREKYGFLLDMCLLIITRDRFRTAVGATLTLVYQRQNNDSPISHIIAHCRCLLERSSYLFLSSVSQTTLINVIKTQYISIISLSNVCMPRKCEIIIIYIFYGFIYFCHIKKTYQTSFKNRFGRLFLSSKHCRKL